MKSLPSQIGRWTRRRERLQYIVGAVLRLGVVVVIVVVVVVVVVMVESQGSYLEASICSTTDTSEVRTPARKSTLATCCTHAWCGTYNTCLL